LIAALGLWRVDFLRQGVSRLHHASPEMGFGQALGEQEYAGRQSWRLKGGLGVDGWIFMLIQSRGGGLSAVGRSVFLP